MTEEGKTLLEDFIARRNHYLTLHDEFVRYARQHSEAYARQRLQTLAGAVAFVIGIPVFYYAYIGLTKWLSMFAIILGCIAVVSASPSEDETRRMVISYMRDQGFPSSDQELIFRIFTGMKYFSDLPQVLTWKYQGLVTQADIDAMGLDLE